MNNVSDIYGNGEYPENADFRAAPTAAKDTTLSDCSANPPQKTVLTEREILEQLNALHALRTE